jgi:hypothetical protein
MPDTTTPKSSRSPTMDYAGPPRCATVAGVLPVIAEPPSPAPSAAGATAGPAVSCDRHRVAAEARDTCQGLYA